MTAVGRISATIVVVAALTLALLASALPDFLHVGDVHVADWLGMMLYLAAPVTWISAIAHWVRRFSRARPRTVWGTVVVLGFVPGAVAYWFWGVRGAEMAHPSGAVE